ncbi:hypothetical protein FRC0140_00526 [Corynebacterium diphtheriae]|nr:hypothetical protein FRC0118_00478 [Corynebacterium diphtheriae]CAB0738389.1 hypothetical protein FRC0140_00526 [Corynebacterium diphtheriae]
MFDAWEPYVLPSRFLPVGDYQEALRKCTEAAPERAPFFGLSGLFCALLGMNKSENFLKHHLGGALEKLPK